MIVCDSWVLICCVKVSWLWVTMYRLVQQGSAREEKEQTRLFSDHDHSHAATLVGVKKSSGQAYINT